MAFLVRLLAGTFQGIKSSKTREQDLKITEITDNHSFNSWVSEMNDNAERGRVNIDIGGVHFVTYRDTLLNIPNTRLAALANRQSEHVFVDRSPFLFEYILDFYRTGELHLPSGLCGLAIKSELEFWGLDETCISTCCWKTYIDSMEKVSTQARIREEFSRLSQKDKRMEYNCSFRVKLWTFLEYPKSSKYAKIYAVISAILVVISLSIIMLGTMPDFREDTSRNLTNYSTDNDISRISKFDRMTKTYPVEPIIYIDKICVAVVSLEFVIKLFVCPNRWTFLKSFSTFSDVVFILPIAIIHIVIWIDWTFWSSNRNISMLIQALITLRILRLHQLARCIRGFTVLALSLKASAKELFLLITLALSTAVVFAFAMFYAELTQEDTFPHAFMGMWWSLITITSVGYGDVYPKTPAGYVVGGVCAIAGLILISLPVPMIANNFNIYYSYRERQERKSHCVWNGRCRDSVGDAEKSTKHKNDPPSAVMPQTERHM